MNDFLGVRRSRAAFTTEPTATHSPSPYPESQPHHRFECAIGIEPMSRDFVKLERANSSLDRWRQKRFLVGADGT